MIDKVNNKKVQEYLRIYQRFEKLYEIGSIINWDTEVNMPSNGASGRGSVSAFLSEETHNTLISKDYENALIEAESESDLNRTEKAILRVGRKLMEDEKNLPSEFVAKLAEMQVLANQSWKNAKKENNFKLFEADLAKMVDLTKQLAEYKGYQNHPYEALLDSYEAGLKFDTVSNIFKDLVPQTKELLKKIKSKQIKSELTNGKFNYPKDSQIQISHFIASKLGIPANSMQIALSAHPFSNNINLDDTRLTTRVNVSDPFYALTSTIHECGHALYSIGPDKNLAETPVGYVGFGLLGVHESQSRSWENFVGRSREFCEFILPVLQSHFSHLNAYTSEDIYNILNEVKPSLIRTEADEVTYNLHIALRFEIEVGLLEGKIKVGELPEYWNQKMKEYIGITPESDSEGVLQDIHWSIGSIGYFPTYTLGNIYAAQLFDTFLKSNPGFFGEVRLGKFDSYLKWLRENVHQYGGIYTPVELIQKVTGENPNAKFLIKHLKEKYSI